MVERTRQRSVRFPIDLIDFAKRQGKKNERNFTKQVVYMLRMAKEEIEKPSLQEARSE